MLQRLIRKIEDPAPSHVFEFSADGIAWASGETLGFQALPPGTLTVSPVEDNIRDEEGVSSELRKVAGAAGGRRRRPCALILPDYCGRVTVLDFDSFPPNADEQASLVRFRMKKSLPFDSDSAAVSFQAQGATNGRQEVVVAAISLEMRCTMGAGVEAGAHIPYHVLKLNPGKPLSASVGTCGSAEERRKVVTARARNAPDLMKGWLEGSESNMSCTCPPTRSVNAGELPLYGMCCMVPAPMATLKASPARCGAVAFPDEAKLSGGFADFAKAINSWTDRAGT